MTPLRRLFSAIFCLHGCHHAAKCRLPGLRDCKNKVLHGHSQLKPTHLLPRRSGATRFVMWNTWGVLEFFHSSSHVLHFELLKSFQVLQSPLFDELAEKLAVPQQVLICTTRHKVQHAAASGLPCRSRPFHVSVALNVELLDVFKFFVGPSVPLLRPSAWRGMAALQSHGCHLH